MVIYTLEIGVAYEGGMLEAVAATVEEIHQSPHYADFQPDGPDATAESKSIYYRKVSAWDLDTGHATEVSIEWGRT